MDSISKNDTPRFFMLAKKASKSAKALPGPHSPCQIRSCIDHASWNLSGFGSQLWHSQGTNASMNAL